MDHDLIVLYKGCDSSAAYREARHAFREVSHTPIQLEDVGYDIGAYQKAVRELSHEYLCFLNTHTEIACEGWLALMHQSVMQPKVGIVGTTGSYESLQASIGLRSEVLMQCKNYRIPYSEAVDSYFYFLTEHACRGWRNQKNSELKKQLRWIQGHLKKLERAIKRKACPIENSREFPAFPNPHIRSNGFLVHRKWMLETSETTIRSKHDACLFESGPNSLTTRIRRAGLRAVVVDRHGTLYDVPEWWKSRTFRIAEQEDILLTDNQSRGYVQLGAGSRYTHSRITWGDYLGDPPGDFPNFGFEFPKNPAVVY